MQKVVFSLSLVVFMMITMGTGCNRNEPSDAEVKAGPEIASSPAKPIESTGDEHEIAPANTPDPEHARLIACVDSLMKMDVVLPALFTEKSYDTAIINSFQLMAKRTGGETKIVATADKLQAQILDVLCTNSRDGGDILFMIDVTGSMADDIAAVRKGMQQIIESLHDRRSVRLAIAIYGDTEADGDRWFRFRNFELDYAAAAAYVDTIRLVHGGVMPESVYEAFFECSKQGFWRSASKRMAIIIGDAPGKLKNDGGSYTLDDVVHKANDGKIRVNLYPILVTPLLERFRQKSGDGPVPFTPRPLITRIYPNPTSDVARIDFMEEGLHCIEAYNAAGVLIDKTNVDDNYWEIDLRRVPDGLYVIRVRDRNNQYDQGKIVVKH